MTITIEALPAVEYEAVQCSVCGADAIPGATPLCRPCRLRWLDTDSYRLARDTEQHLVEAWAAAMRAQRDARQVAAQCSECGSMRRYEDGTCFGCGPRRAQAVSP